MLKYTRLTKQRNHFVLYRYNLRIKVILTQFDNK